MQNRFTPRRLYYGWVIVAVMAVAGGWTLSMGVANFGFFINPMREDLGFDRTVFGWASSARTAGAALGGIFIGRLIDRHGARVLLALFGGGGALLIAALAYVTTEWHLVAVYAIVGLLGMQGGANIYTGPVVSKWFVRNRARAMSMTYLGLPVALIAAFPLTQQLIEAFGWRTAWAVIGLIGVALIVPASLLFLRRQPGDLGMGVDGGAPEAPEESGAAPSEEAGERSWTRGEALRSMTFWRLTLAFGLHMAGQQSVSLFRFPHYEDQGVSATLIGYAASLEGVASIASAFTVAFVAGRLGLQWTAAVGFALMIASHVFTIIASNGVEVAAAVALFGLAVTYLVVAQNLIYPAFFGRRHIGAIRGVSLAVSMGLGAVSAPLTGYVADITGDFAPIWWGAVGVLALSGVLIATTKAPAPKRDSRLPESVA